MTRPRGRSKRVSVHVDPGRFAAARGLGPWLERHVPASVRGSLAIKIVSDREMARLNSAYRGKPQPTDVLSFPSGESGSTASTAPRRSYVAGFAVIGHRLTINKIKHLGDIAIASGVARRQARALGHPVSVELRVLALHGILHLLGYDHERDRGEMRAVEERWRKRAGLPSGLVARAD
jgi:probable rRNA maturation factor